MLAPNPHPTPYPDLNDYVARLLSDVQANLADQFVGMYLEGSLASGDFDPEQSDIDFIVVTANTLSVETLQALTAMHERLAAHTSKWAQKLEGAYIPLDAMRCYDPNRVQHPTLQMEWSIAMAQHDPDWVIHRHVLREGGVTLAGPPPKTLIDPVRPAELQQAVVVLLEEWWALMISDPTRLQGPGYQPYAVLTMCRARYTLQYGDIVSKPAAARWALGTLGRRWKPLIEKALAGKGDTQMESIRETQNFIRHVVECSKEFSV